MKYVKPIGSKDAKICLIGEAPGKDEEAIGIPFIGNSGKLLRQLLGNAGIDFNNCYITNVVKYRPPDNDITRLKEIGIELSKCVIELYDELLDVKSNVYVALGNTALQAMTGFISIDKYRGSILNSTLLPGRKVIPTIHPAALFHRFNDTALVMSDLKKVKIESEHNDFRNLLKRSFIIKPTFDNAIKELNNILTLQNNQPKKVTLDIETPMSAPYILCVGLTDNYNTALCIPFVDGGQPLWSMEEEKFLWKLIKQILNSPQHYKVIQNAQFEMDVLFNMVGEITPITMDTMIGHHLLYSELPKGLDTLCSLYTNEPYYKDDAKTANYASKALWEYNCKDVAITHEVSEVIHKELVDAKLVDFMYGYQMPLLKILWQASKVGVNVDKQRLNEYKCQYKKESIEAQEELNILVGRDINVNSPKQVGNLIYGEMNLPKSIHKKTGKLTTDNEAIERLNKLKPNKIFDLILKVRGTRKLLSTYLIDLTDEDGRMRTNWVITGTENGRLSSRKNIRGSGTNLQNQPKHIRDIYIADEGCSFVVGDLSQVEARFVAWLANDYNFKKIFNEGGDIHSKVASWIFKVPADLVTKEQRSKAKSVVHGANYQIGIRTFAQSVGVNTHEAEWLLNQYYFTFPAIKQWHKNIVNQLYKDRTLVNPFGRRRIFFGFWGDALFREAYAFIPQSSAVDYLCTAFAPIYYQLPEGATILLQVHDEVVIQCRNNNVDEVCKLLKKEVERSVMVNNDLLTIPIDIKIGKNWRDVVEWKEM